MRMEFGDFNDNFEIFSTARRRMQNGSLDEGLRILDKLRTHIIQTSDVKSRRWLLPKLEICLREQMKR